MERIKKIVLLFCSALLLASFIGCERKGTAEKAGEKIDKVTEKVGDKVHDTVDAVGEKIEETGKKLQK